MRTTPAALTIALTLAFVGKGYGNTGTAQIHTVPIPNGMLTLEIASLPSESSWAVGVLVNSDPEAKIAMFRTVIDRSKPMSSMDALAELTPDHAAFASGSCRVTLSDPGSVGLLVQAPAGTKIAITFNGVQYSSSILSTAFMIQDGTIRSGALESGGAFLLKMHTKEFSAPPDFLRHNDVLYASAALAHAHLVKFVRPAVLTTACCGARITVLADLTIDESGSVLSVKTRTLNPSDTHDIETALRSWKFDPFIYEGQPSLVHVLAPIDFVSGKVMSPLF